MRLSSIRTPRLIAIGLLMAIVLTFSRATSTAHAQPTTSCDTPNLSIAVSAIDTYPAEMQIGDFNGDHRPDLIWRF